MWSSEMMRAMAQRRRWRSSALGQVRMLLLSTRLRHISSTASLHLSHTLTAQSLLLRAKRCRKTVPKIGSAYRGAWRLVAGDGFVVTAENGDKPQVTAKPGVTIGVYQFKAAAGVTYRIDRSASIN
jgi:hypothetical protein